MPPISVQLPKNLGGQLALHRVESRIAIQGPSAKLACNDDCI